MDRSNLGNAKTDGLDTDLHLVGNQYSNTLVIFYITFCLFDLPLNLLLKKLSGKIMLPTLMLGWSVFLPRCCVSHLLIRGQGFYDHASMCGPQLGRSSCMPSTDGSLRGRLYGLVFRPTLSFLAF